MANLPCADLFSRYLDERFNDKWSFSRGSDVGCLEVYLVSLDDRIIGEYYLRRSEDVRPSCGYFGKIPGVC